MPYFGNNSGGGGGSTNNQHVIFFEKKGPSSYATGGFVIDLSATYSSLNDLELEVKKGTRGSLPGGNYRVTLNSPANGKATVIWRQHQYTKTTAIGNVSGQPSGVTVQASSGVASSSESSHTHAIDHNHAAFNSSAATNTGAAVNSSLATLSQNVGSHVHSVDFPTLTGTSGAGSSHSHIDSNIYAHAHTDTQTSTNLSSIELANATDISATTFIGMASGVRL